MVKISANKKDEPVRVDVNDLVRIMLRKGNYRFLLSYGEDEKQTISHQFLHPLNMQTLQRGHD